MEEQPFGRFIRQRRREMDLTQDELARRVGCAAITIRKIEAEDARPSVQIAERLALSLAIPLEDRAEFVHRARAIRPETDHSLSGASLRLEEIGSEDLTGRAIRGYALTEKIGSGSMGAVYRAVQPTVGREVAIKIILPKFANHPDFIRRFETEAQLVARLEHPHIVPLYDYWREPGVAYLVMRLLRGGNLQSLVETGPLSADRVLRLVEQIGSALTSAHRIGVIHRDLKPANILLDEDQNAYLADFGIAQHLGTPQLTGETQPGAVIGSPQYTSPEQFHYYAFRPQSDIYCLGVMLYEMLTGRIPFVGPTPIDFLQQHISAPMPPLSAHRTGLPAALDAVIARATAKNPEERYADVPSMLLDFRQAVSGMVSQPVFLEEEVVPHEVLNPYKGLRPFSEADADDFFGRETLIQQLLARLSEGGDLARFLAVIGPSGSGKSSVVKAGLMPALRRGGLLNSENWFYVDIQPGGNPFEELEAALLRVAVRPPSRLLDLLKEGNRGLTRAVNCILPDDRSVELVLVIDQFEELFTLLENENERALFLGNLVTAILDESSRLRVIVTLRADFIDRPLRYVDFGELIQRRNEFVLPLTPDELEQAIIGPARRHGLRIESGLVFSILSDLGDQPGILPMLQYALTELFDQREGNVLTKQGYQRIGGVLGALSRRADEVYLGMNERGQSIAQQLFLRLITLGEGVEDTRRRVLLMELEQLRTAGEPSGLSHPVHGVMELFSRSRLLIFDIDPITRGPTVEVSHESLLREWPRLRTWVDESRTDVHLQRQLASAAQEWRNAGCDQSFLLTGAHLEQFDGWSQTTKLAFTQHEREFLAASLELADREKAERAKGQAREATLKLRVQRVLQALAGVFLLAAVISGTLAYWANGQREEALRQASIGLASQAQLESQGTSPERGVLLAVEALEEYPYTWQAEQKLAEILHEFRLRQILSGHTATVSDVAWSPDGDYVATASRDGTVRIWDTTSWITLSTIQAHAAFDSDFSNSEFATGEAGVRAVVWSPDGKHILTLGNTDRTVHIWDASTGGKTTSFSFHEDLVLSASWSPDGKAVITSGRDGSVFVWDSITGEVRLEFPTQPTPIQSVRWSPNGSFVATSGEDGFIKLWEARTGDELDMLTGHEGIVWSISWSPDGTRLASAGEDGTIRIWDMTKGEEISIIRSSSAFWQVTWSPDGSQLATTNANGLAQVWDVSTPGEAYALSGRAAGRFTIAWSPDGKRLATTSRTDSVVRIWTTSLEPVAIPSVHTEQAGWVMWSPNGNRIATGSDDFLSIIWDANTGSAVHHLKGHTNWVQQAVWSPDGSHIATASFDNTVRIWDAMSGEEEFTFTGHSADPINRLFESKGVLNVIWSPDGSQVASQGLTGWVRVWDSNTHKEVLVFQTNEDLSEPMSWSPDGSRIATCAAPQILQVWDADTGETLIGGFVNNTSHLTFQDFIPFCISTSWSPDGKKILTAGWDGSATIWDSDTGEKLLTFSGHGQPINAAVWSPNGARIATGDNSGVIKIWIAETGQELFSFKTNHPFIFSLSWSPDGSRLAGTGGLVSPSVWRVWQSTEDLMDYAHECCMVGELTSEYRQQLGVPAEKTE